MKQLKYVFGHTAWNAGALQWHRNLVERYRAGGYDVRALCLVPNAPGPHYTFEELDRRWRRRDGAVVGLYRRLKEALDDADVFINFNGANVHPEWLRDFRTFNVYRCWDDPESSASLSKPVAAYYDFAFTGNAGCLPMYESWGVQRCDFLPHGLYEGEYDPTISVDRILHDDRELDAVFFGERESEWRRRRLDGLREAFPKAIMRGRGWPGGFVSDDEKLAIYARAKIGWNLHNSIGPVNLRVFSLPANGTLQICDNKCRLGQLFELGREIVGFDSIEECIDLTHYYLKHEDERREIAARGFQRVFRDYTEGEMWERMIEIIAPCVAEKRNGQLKTDVYERASKRIVRRAHRGIVQVGKRVLKRIGLRPARTGRGVASHGEGEPSVSYRENHEVGPVNLSEKVKRQEKNECFEWPNMVALNWAVAARVGTAKQIVELGGGTGCFAYEASADESRAVLCVDLDSDAIDWARAHRKRGNISYSSKRVTPEDGPFDLLVAVDLIEHIADFPGLLRLACQLAPRALITTPNRARDGTANHAGPPAYEQHVREWTAGEFYWILRSFYRDVQLFSMPDPYVPLLRRISVTDSMTPIVAECQHPLFSENVAA